MSGQLCPYCGEPWFGHGTVCEPLRFPVTPPPDKLVEEMDNLLKLPGMFPETRQLIEQAIKAQISQSS